MAAVACQGIVRMLLGWQHRGERVVVGMPWCFGAAALQHHWQREGRTVAAVGVPRRFGGRNIRATAG